MSPIKEIVRCASIVLKSGKFSEVIIQSTDNGFNTIWAKVAHVDKEKVFLKIFHTRKHKCDGQEASLGLLVTSEQDFKGRKRDLDLSEIRGLSLSKRKKENILTLFVSDPCFQYLLSSVKRIQD